MIKTLTNTESSSKTIQFLMGLNETFDPIRNQILMQEPLPNINKVFGMLLNMESQIQVQKGFKEMLNSSVMMTKTQSFSKNGNKGNMKRRDGKRKEDRYCEHCKIQGHSKDTCFKLHG